MKRIVFASALLFLLVGITSLAPAPKHKYSSKEGKLKVTFPGEFTASEQSTDTYKSVKVQAISEDMVFFVGYTIHETPMTDKEQLAQVSLDAFSEGLSAKVTKKETWVVKKQNGLRAFLEVEESGLKGEYRVVIVGQIQYQITAVSPEDSWNEETAQKFFKSFKVKK